MITITRSAFDTIISKCVFYRPSGRAPSFYPRHRLLRYRVRHRKKHDIELINRRKKTVLTRIRRRVLSNTHTHTHTHMYRTEIWEYVERAIYIYTYSGFVYCYSYAYKHNIVIYHIIVIHNMPFETRCRHRGNTHTHTHCDDVVWPTAKEVLFIIYIHI